MALAELTAQKKRLSEGPDAKVITRGILLSFLLFTARMLLSGARSCWGVYFWDAKDLREEAVDR
jgi:hypothetical protein